MSARLTYKKPCVYLHKDNESCLNYAKSYVPAEDRKCVELIDKHCKMRAIKPITPTPTPTPTHKPRKGVKDDKGKPRVGLVLSDFSLALMEVAKVGTIGANKYTDHGWLDVPNGKDRYTDAMLRHWLQSQTQTLDDESNLHHLAHQCWNALAVLELLLKQEKQKE